MIGGSSGSPIYRNSREARPQRRAVVQSETRDEAKLLLRWPRGAVGTHKHAPCHSYDLIRTCRAVGTHAPCLSWTLYMCFFGERVTASYLSSESESAAPPKVT